MEEEIRLAEPRTDEEKYFQPEWLEQARSEINEAMKGMTPEERIAYINQRGAAFREQSKQCKGDG